MTDPRYTDQEMAVILRRAAELSSGDARQHSLTDIQRIAEEVGISPDAVARAASLPIADPEAPTFWGAPSSSTVTRIATRRASATDLLAVTALVRSRMKELGESRELAGGLEWRFDTGYSSAILTVVPDGETTAIRIAGRFDGRRFVLYGGAVAASVLAGFVATTAATPEFSAAVAVVAAVPFLAAARALWNRTATAGHRRLREVADEVAALLDRGLPQP
jgi:hypothetical protein